MKNALADFKFLLIPPWTVLLILGFWPLPSFAVGTNETGCFAPTSHSDMIVAMMTEPFGQTNTLYYAGLSNGCSILIHETNRGLNVFESCSVVIDGAMRFPFSTNRCDWIALKENDKNSVAKWNLTAEVNNFINSLPTQSAIVKPVKEWLEIKRIGDECIFRRNLYEVCMTLSPELGRGDIICTTQLYDAPLECKTNVMHMMRSKRVLTTNLEVNAQDLLLVKWDHGMFDKVSVLTNTFAYCIGDEIAGSLGFFWELNYGDLLPYEESELINAYSNRVANVFTQQKKK